MMKMGDIKANMRWKVRRRNKDVQSSPLTLRGPQHCAPGMSTRFQTILDYLCYVIICYTNKSVQDQFEDKHDFPSFLIDPFSTIV